MSEALLLPPTPSLRALPFAVIDLETSGGTPKPGWDKEGRFRPGAEITEVGVVKLSGLVRQGSFQRLCAIEGTLPAMIQSLTGITPALLRGAPSWEQVALALAPELEGRIWVAHHAPFDGSFLKAWLPQGLWHRHRLICTRLLVKRLVPELTSRSLGDCCAHFGIVNARAHRALADAEATAELLQQLLTLADAQAMEAESFLEAGSVDWAKL